MASERSPAAAKASSIGTAPFCPSLNASASASKIFFRACDVEGKHSSLVSNVRLSVVPAVTKDCEMSCGEVFQMLME